ncbi:hypothetical protein [Streptomyces sp. SID6139]|uniref:hypothetical protein n=1 Tax=Streptomyces sp. SID6139 TaxID=2690320 RepID=UPI00387EC431
MHRPRPSPARSRPAGLPALPTGLGTSVLVGQRRAESATEVLAYHLDRIFRLTGISG